jgi:hypothetical protein
VLLIESHADHGHVPVQVSPNNMGVFYGMTGSGNNVSVTTDYDFAVYTTLVTWASLLKPPYWQILR